MVRPQIRAKSIIDLYCRPCYVRNLGQDEDWKLLLLAGHLSGGVLVIFSTIDAHVLRYYSHNFPALYVKGSPHKVSNFPDIQNATGVLI